MRRRLSRKRGGNGGLNSHIENYVKELNDENRENKLQEHKQLYLNAYARHNKIESHIKGPWGFYKQPNPVIEDSFNKRVANEKIRLKEEEELKRKQQEEIVARNLEKDKQKRIQHGVARKTMGLSQQRKQGEKDKLALMRARAEAKKMGSRVISIDKMPSSPASRYVAMKKASDARGPSKLRGGKRRTRKRNRRSRKNKKGGKLRKSIYFFKDKKGTFKNLYADKRAKDFKHSGRKSYVIWRKGKSPTAETHHGKFYTKSEVDKLRKTHSKNKKGGGRKRRERKRNTKKQGRTKSKKIKRKTKGKTKRQANKKKRLAPGILQYFSKQRSI